MTEEKAGGRRRLGVFGTSESGKTTFLTSLGYILWRQIYRAEYDYPPEPSQDVDGPSRPTERRTWLAVMTDDLRDMIIRNQKRMEDEREWPLPTGTGALQRFDFQLRNKPANVVLDIHFYDFPGEMLDMLEDDDSPGREGKPKKLTPEQAAKILELQEHFDSCDGYIFLVDGEDLRKEPLREQRVYDRLLRRIERVHGGKIGKPCIFAFTKMDMAPNEYEDPRQFSQRNFGGTHSLICEAMADVGFTAVSSSGGFALKPDGKTRPVLKSEEINVEEPFFKIVLKLTDDIVKKRKMARVRRGRRRRVLLVASALIVLAVAVLGSTVYKGIARQRNQTLAASLHDQAEVARSRGLWNRALELVRQIPVLLPEVDDPREREFTNRGPVRELGNGLGMKFVLVERPGAKHDGSLDGYYMGMHEVSRGQFEQFLFTEDRGYEDQAAVEKYAKGENAAAIYVSWEEARGFCAWLTQDERAAGLLGFSEVYRLPTEGEWELAAAGPEGRKYPWGDRAPNHELCNVSDIAERHGYVALIDSYPAGRSPFGCFNMSGNVWEWCLNPYHPSGSEAGDLRLNSKEEHRVLRGGAWSVPSRFATTKHREASPGDKRSEAIGFRVVRAAPPSDP